MPVTITPYPARIRMCIAKGGAMRTREEYYELVLENRRLAKDPRVTRCTCPNTLCDWHGKCRECVALHRYHKSHVPFCLQFIIKDRVQALAATVEMETALSRPHLGIQTIQTVRV